MAKVVLSFSQTVENLNQTLTEKYTEFEVFAYLIEDMHVQIQHLENLRKEMHLTLEEFAELCDDALLTEVRPYGNDENPYGLLKKSDGNSRKARMEVRDE